jgi:TonB family protein
MRFPAFTLIALAGVVLAPSARALAPSALTQVANSCGKATDDATIAACSRLIDRDPKNVRALVIRGKAYKSKGDLDRAITDLNRAIARNPELAEPYRIRGSAYAEKRDFNSAITDYDNFLRINPNDKGVFMDRAVVQDAKGDDIRTSSDYARVLMARLLLSKHYPREALQRREEGEVHVVFEVDRTGKVISSHVDRSSGFATLDAEALGMIRRAQPFPPLPEGSENPLKLGLPVRFNLNPVLHD